MGTISRPNDYKAGTIAVAAQVNQNESTIFNEFNGNIDNDNIKVGAGITDNKLAQITTASKVSTSALTGTVTNVISTTNITSTTLTATNISGLTTALSTVQGGTGVTSNSNAAGGVVILNASSQLPAVSGALLTNLPNQIVFAAGSVVFAHSNTEAYDGDGDNNGSNTYVKSKEILVGTSGTITIAFDLKSNRASTYTVYGKIYVNGVAVGTERSTTSTTYVTQANENITVAAGDLVQLYCHGQASTHCAYVANFNLKCATFFGGYVRIATTGGAVIAESP